MMRVLAAGVDSLTVTRQVEVPERTLAHLDGLRERARIARDDKAPPPTVDVDGQLFEVQPGAAFPFRHLLRSDEAILTIAGQNRPGQPSLRVEVPQAALWARGWRAAYERAASYLDALATQDLETGEVFPHVLTVEKVARVDLCADFQGWRPVGSDVENERFVCRARVTRRKRPDDGKPDEEPELVKLHGRAGKNFTGYEWARGQPLMVRLYCKTAEIAKSGKDWMRAVWARAEGYDPEAPVWRLEVQWRREVLHEAGYDGAFPTVELDALWGYAFGAATGGRAWLSLRAPDRDSNRSRWPVDEERWRPLQEVRFVDGANPAARDRRREGDAKRAVAAARGHLASLAALSDLDAPTGGALLDRTYEVFRERLEERERREPVEQRFHGRVKRRQALRKERP